MATAGKATGPAVSVIPATKRSVQNGGQLKQQTNIRVAAYCRVSTGDESQQTSYTNQKAFYSGLIQSKAGWRFAGIYADEAISGTSRAHRDEFNRMMEDAKKGKLDYIVTKSISRFARNTVDTLNCVRELRQQNPPVGIYFEKENIDTLDATGELILTILSALAQDESRSISDNIRWTFQKNFQAGIPQINLNRMIGYDKAEDGTWVINPEQAAVVRYIFERYVCGQSAKRIAEELNKMGRKTINNKNWSCSSIMTVLRNEKYVGDLEMQKTITKDFLTHRSTVNNGEAPRYYVENHHVGIIDRVTWDKVQAMLYEKPRKSADRGAGEKKKQKGPKGSPFSNLRCGAILPETGKECGEGLFRLTYTGVASGYTDDRSLAATGGDTSRYLEKYSYAYPVWRCKRKFGERKENIPRTGSTNDKKYCRSKKGCLSDAEKAQAEKNCPSELLHECAIEQSFMEMLYALKRDYEANGDASRICTLFQEAYDRTYQRVRVNSVSIQRMETLDGQIKELEDNLQKTIGKQVKAMREAALEQNAELNEALAEGNITLDDIEINIRNGLTGSDLGTSYFNMEIEEGSEAAVYADLAKDLRRRLAEFRQQRSTLESEQGITAVMQKNFDFFLKCLKELPEVNGAGMKIMVNGLDVQGSLFRNVDGTAKAGVRSSLNNGHMALTPEKVAASPDFLRFERGIYVAFIASGTIRGDCIEYTTNFGVKLMTAGNRRTLGSFIGFKKCRDDGTVEILDAPYKVCGNSIQYRRYLRRGAKEEEAVVDQAAEEIE